MIADGLEDLTRKMKTLPPWNANRRNTAEMSRHRNVVVGNNNDDVVEWQLGVEWRYILVASQKGYFGGYLMYG